MSMNAKLLHVVHLVPARTHMALLNAYVLMGSLTDFVTQTLMSALQIRAQMVQPVKTLQAHTNVYVQRDFKVRIVQKI
jgi:hypothetical protein